MDGRLGGSGFGGLVESLGGIDLSSDIFLELGIFSLTGGSFLVSWWCFSINLLYLWRHVHNISGIQIFYLWVTGVLLTRI